MNLKTIREKIKAGKYIISFTHTEKIRLRKIEAEEIEEAICEGTIIEPYLDDSRGASCLILGLTKKDRPLDVVCGRLEEEEILIITTYEPDSKEWEADWKPKLKPHRRSATSPNSGDAVKIYGSKSMPRNMEIN